MTFRAAVVGHPVAHSLSPRIFRALAEAAGKPLRYEAIDVLPEKLGTAILEAARGSCVGWNVTLPHKVEVLAHLDAAEASAIEAGAANVVHFLGGKCVGHNTDVEGFLAPLERRGLRVSGMRATVLGSGGASRAVCAALRRAGVAGIRIVARDAARAGELARRWGGFADAWTPGGVTDALAWGDLVVNATPLGLDGAASPLPPGAMFRRGALAYDLVYGVRETPFLRRARDCGAEGLMGLGMLVAQAAATWRIWFGEVPPAGALERIEAGLGEEMS
jgi:shikimate dehydrogenase